MNIVLIALGLICIAFLSVLLIRRIKHCHPPQRRIRSAFALMFLSFTATIATAADDSPYAAHKWSVSPFASYRAHELGSFNGKFGAGLALEYAPVDNVAIELSTVSEGIDPSPLVDSLKEAAVNLKGYLPLGKSGFAPYGLIGYTAELHQSDEAHRMNAGAGIAWRHKRLNVFADGQWTHNFQTLGHALFRAGLGLTF